MAKKHKLSTKARTAMKSDVFASLAIVSIFLNLFLLVGVVMYTSTNKLDRAVFRSAISNLCDEHYDENRADAKAQNGESGARTIDIVCQQEGFDAFHADAVEAYLKDLDN